MYFDVVLVAPIKDRRAAYHAARSLEGLEGQPLGFLDLKQELEDAPGILVPLVARSIAIKCARRLEYYGIAAEVTVHSEVLDPGAVAAGGHLQAARSGVIGFVRGRPGTTFAIAAGIVLVVALVGVGRNRSSSEQEHVVANMEELALVAEHATVHLKCGNQLGAGFFIDDDLVVTNAHVLCEGETQIDVTLANGQTRRGLVVKRNEWLDAALVRVAGFAAEPLEMADATHLDRGEQVFLMGSPHGMDFSFSQGMVSHPNRSIMGISYIQIDAGVNPGNSGGPLLDADGHAVGIVSMMVGASDNIGLALPINYLIAGAQALLPTSETEIDRERWQARVRKAVADDRHEVEKVTSEFGHAGLIGAFHQQPYGLVATVARWSDNPPPEEHFAFELSNDGSTICLPSGNSGNWRSVQANPSEFFPPRYLMWLERNGLLRNMYTTSVRLDTDFCTVSGSIIGATLNLNGGSNSAHEVIVQRGPG